ncbi:RdRP-domain-containing protein, partial [Coniophora puteana RWD-64-598 SS2]
IRVLLSEPGDLEKFVEFCGVVGLRAPTRGRRIDATGLEKFFAQRRVDRLTGWMKSLDWPVAFQVAALLHNGLLNTQEIESIRPIITQLSNKSAEHTGDTLRLFTEKTRSQTSFRQPLELLDELVNYRASNQPRRTPPAGHFFCSHVTITPTRMLLEGPYITQSNRVIRKYDQFKDHFIRVEFREENRQKYRWEREVDVLEFLTSRVGAKLKGGVDVAGRRFSFVAYSPSALRNHSLWFVCEEGFRPPVQILKELGNFSATTNQPAKRAARMGVSTNACYVPQCTKASFQQAFSATQPSIKVSKDQIVEIPDITGPHNNPARPPHVFTDGIGTISPKLRDRICEALSISTKPDAFQVRCAGLKGVFVVDHQLEGKIMCPRPSMKKFLPLDESEDAEIEIVRAFDKPGRSFLNRPLVMVLEDRGVKTEGFLELFNDAVADARTAHDSVDQFVAVLQKHRLGIPYRLDQTLLKLKALGLVLRTGQDQESLDTDFLARVRLCVIKHILRDIRHSARIPIPGSYQLVGVADEGQAYINAGKENVFTLRQGQIYACIQDPSDAEPQWLQGTCVISRSPVVHPGDVQRVYAIGKPPENQLCAFARLKNVVVFASRGTLPLANCLGGDGHVTRLFITEQVDPTEYDAREPYTLDRPVTLDDICDFVVEYIHSDVVGLVADTHIIIADASSDGTLDRRCLELAKMHSQAVDYLKNGIPVDIRRMPRRLIPFKPDWHEAEDESSHPCDYYRSNRALGHMYRTKLDEDRETLAHVEVDSYGDSISQVVQQRVNGYPLAQASHQEQRNVLRIVETIFKRYQDELRYICMTHSLTDAADDCLREEEVIASTILAKCSQKGWRKDRLHRMRECATHLVQETRRDLIGDLEVAPSEEVRNGLHKAWAAWQQSINHRAENSTELFGTQSFGWLALGAVLDCLENLGVINRK